MRQSSNDHHSYSLSDAFSISCCLTYSAALAFTFSTLFAFPSFSSNSNHLLKKYLAFLLFSLPDVTRPNSRRAWSFSPCLISRSSSTFHKSSRFGKVLRRPSKMVRPRSGSPCCERNSSCANLEVKSRWVNFGRDCMARGSKARPRSGALTTPKRKVA